MLNARLYNILTLSVIRVEKECQFFLKIECKMFRCPQILQGRHQNSPTRLQPSYSLRCARPRRYSNYFFTDCYGTTSVNERMRKYFFLRTMDGLVATANTAQKNDDFHVAFGGLQPQTPNAYPQMSCALRSRISSLSCPVPKIFGPLADFLGKFFQ